MIFFPIIFYILTTITEATTSTSTAIERYFRCLVSLGNSLMKFMPHLAKGNRLKIRVRGWRVFFALEEIFGASHIF